MRLYLVAGSADGLWRVLVRRRRSIALPPDRPWPDRRWRWGGVVYGLWLDHAGSGRLANPSDLGVDPWRPFTIRLDEHQPHVRPRFA